MAKSKSFGAHKGATSHTPPEPAVPTLPPMTDADRAASHRAYLVCKPALDAAMSKINGRSLDASRPVQPNHPERIKSGPNVGYVCTTHHLPLDPWGICHYECGRCLREAPYQRIWTHKGSCRPTQARLAKMVAK